MENAQNNANLLSYDLNNIAALDEWLIKVQNNDPSLKFKFDSITINDAPSVAIKNTAEFGEIIQIIQNLPFSLKRTNNSFCTVEISNYDSDGTLRPEPNIKLNFNIFGWIQDAEPYASVKDFKQDCLKLASFRNRIYILKHPDEEIELEDDNNEEIEIPTPTTHLEEPKVMNEANGVEAKAEDEKSVETTNDEVVTNNQTEQKDETPSENETSHKETSSESESTNDNAPEETVINTQAAFANSTSSSASSFMAPTTIDKFADAISRILDRIDSRPAINLNSREQMMRQRDHMLALTLQDLEPVNTIN